jgi:predicted porin
VNSSYNRLADDSSRVVFNMVEDLGGGLQAVGQYDIRIKFDDQGSIPGVPSNGQNVGGNIASGNTHVGLRSKSWGRIIFGRQDLHYFNTESSLTTRGSLRADSISLLAFAKGGGTAIANATRVQNTIQYLTPNWGGFTLIAAYSTNPTAADNDLGQTGRKGRAWNLNPNFAGANWQVGYSYWSQKSDIGTTTAAVAVANAATCAAGTTAVINVAATATTPAFSVCGTAPGTPDDQRADRLYGSYAWGGFKLGLAWDRSKLKNAVSGASTGNRTAWSLPVSYIWGPHEIHAHYTKARDDKDIANTAVGDQSAKMFAIAYAYNLSKRTAAAITYSKITNSGAAAYNFFTSTSLGDAAGGVLAGEDPRLLSATLRHAF